MEKDHKDLIAELNSHEVEYVIVGGVAVSAHGIPRYTKDLDIYIRSSEANSEAVFRALAAYGAPLIGTTPSDFADGKTVLQIGVEPNRVDILQSISGVDFDQVWKNRLQATIEEGITVAVISKEDLIKNKLSAGRPRDLADADELRRLK